MNKVFGFALMALAFASCQNSDNNETADVVTSDTATIATSSIPAIDPGTQGAMNSAPAGGTATAPSAPAIAATTVPAGEGLNPAHGLPGHRCDIAVGAPLNSPAGNSPAPAVSGSPAPAMNQAPAMAQPADKNAKLNPAHGQPGHDCTIPVGQPLKS